MLILQIIYSLNVLVAGFVGITALFYPDFSSHLVFQNTISSNWAQRIVGGLWLSIALLSCLGVFQPLKYSPVLLIQLIYKAAWLIFIIVPAWRTGRLKDLPMGMTWFFLIWVVGLFIFLPYRYLFAF